MSKYSLSQKLVERVGQNALDQLKQDVQNLKDELNAQEVGELPGQLFLPAEHNTGDEERTGFSNYSYWRSTFRMFFKNRVAVFTLAVVVIIVTFTIIQPYLPGQMDPNRVNNNPETGLQLINNPPSADHWFGTNAIGQDLWARIWAGTRTSLFICLSVALVQAVVGITMGVFVGYLRKLDFMVKEI